VTTGNRFHREVAEALGDLQATDGVVAVLGNHDNFGEREPLLSTFAERNVRVLANSRHTIERIQADGSTATFEIVGIDDVYTRRADVEIALAGASRPPLVGLAHDPRLFDALATHGVSLVLSGHTHWGQVGVPFFADRVNLARPIFGERNVGATRGTSRLIVSPGLGSTGPPVRFGVAPAVLLITLRCTKPAASEESATSSPLGEAP
jgi:predicted MPP superfamily phosphohydrolase